MIRTRNLLHKKINKMIKTTLYNQKLLKEKHENLKVDSDTIKEKKQLHHD